MKYFAFLLTINKQLQYDPPYTFVCWLFFASRLDGLFGFQHACNISVGSFWLSLLVKQKQPTQKPTNEETSSSINKSWMFTGIELSTEKILLNFFFKWWGPRNRVKTFYRDINFEIFAQFFNAKVYC